jgi:spore maturation protein SpmA
MGAASNQIFLTTIVATGLSTIAAIIAVKTLEKMNRFNVDRDKQDD